MDTHIFFFLIFFGLGQPGIPEAKAASVSDGRRGQEAMRHFQTLVCIYDCNLLLVIRIL